MQQKEILKFKIQDNFLHHILLKSLYLAWW